MPESFELLAGETITAGGLRIVLRERTAVKGDEKQRQERSNPTTVALDCPNFDGADGEGRFYSVRMGVREFERLGAPLCPICKQKLVRRRV